jgi:hypothetical protein
MILCTMLLAMYSDRNRTNIPIMNFQYRLEVPSNGKKNVIPNCQIHNSQIHQIKLCGLPKCKNLTKMFPTPPSPLLCKVCYYHFSLPSPSIPRASPLTTWTQGRDLKEWRLPIYCRETCAAELCKAARTAHADIHTLAVHTSKFGSASARGSLLTLRYSPPPSPQNSPGLRAPKSGGQPRP